MPKTIEINHQHVPVKNLDKVFWNEDGYTKADIMEYYAKIWPYLAPHIYKRPVSLVRYPNGIAGDFFYQKDVPDPPAWLDTIAIPSDERTIHYALLNNLESLIWSINLGCIEVHPWLSTTDALENPTYIIFDLDPMPPADFQTTVLIAQNIRFLLNELHLEAFPKLSGATGIHIYVPIQPIYSYDQTSHFVKKIGEIIIKSLPDLATNERNVAKRGGKVYIDHLQNLWGKTIAAVFSLRPFPGAPVSMPVRWEELPDLQPGTFSIKDSIPRLEKIGDLFHPLLSLRQALPKALVCPIVKK